MPDDTHPALGESRFPSRWGADEEIGAGNLLEPHKVLQASKNRPMARRFGEGWR